MNGRTLEEYFPNKLHQQLINDPFKVLDLLGSYDVVAKITGGGPSGQAGALRLAIARALIEVSPEDRPALKKAGFLKIYPRDFFVLNLWKYMAWLALILTSVYLLYRFAFKRAPAEEQSSDVYRQFGGSQTGPNTDRLISETTR